MKWGKQSVKGKTRFKSLNRRGHGEKEWDTEEIFNPKPVLSLIGATLQLFGLSSPKAFIGDP